MTTTPEVTRGVLVPVSDPLFTLAEREALGGFVSGYSGLTRDAYTLDLRQYTAWCTRHGLHLFEAKRVDIESFRGDIGSRRSRPRHHRAPTVHHRRVLPLRRRRRPGKTASHAGSS